MIYTLTQDEHINLLVAAGCSPQTATAQVVVIKQARQEVINTFIRAYAEVPASEFTNRSIPDIKEKTIKLAKAVV
jgi:hypothetical protein